MKKLPELRFDGYDGEWEEKKLGDSFTVTMGQSPNSENYTVDSDFLPLIGGNTDIKQGKINPSIFTTQETKKSYPGNIIMTVRAPVGDLAMNSSEVVIGRGVCSIDGNNYLYYNLEKKKYENYWRRFISGSTFESINSSDIKSVLISTPKNSEQEKIGDLFKKIDDLIEIQEGKVTKVRYYKKSMLQKIFPKKDELVPEFRFDGFNGNWEKLTLGDIGEVQSSGVNKIIYNNQKLVRLLNYMDVYNKKSPTNSNIDTFMETSASDKEMSSKDVTKGDIFFTPTSETAEDIGHSMVVEDYIKGMVYSYHIFRFRPNSDVLDINFSDYFCNIDPVRKQLKIKAQGAQRYTLKLNDFRELIIKNPPLAEQQKIGQFFKNLDTQIENEEKLLESYKMMKKSLLQKMFV
ncbi:restriction endonuclease subunit S [Anaerococcus sp.]|uniref:restriction endonuclease subunit S n=1 Tax=Anaerococcus sp. TaxID=1872515 RepID=UPI002590F7C5|nr:restriction endonuclease subunit S [Anaerococcus sp.]MDU3210711.1 restriction endonuclease subunit S [Anaerococcus sp.]